ncbi:MAG: hypothetical protein APF76_09920 [Desulfitibacter sp. BRH_c19]|nr:MAG: hypothetical protein APF76_09920 [Desulfitibacter sp. BRH_c19]
MIGNKYLQAFYEYPDEDTSLNQLLEFLKSKDKKFLDSLYEPVDINACNDNEIIFLTKISALIDYHLQLHGFEVPNWLRDEKLRFEKPYYHSKRISDFDKVKLLYTNPAPFRARNVYFELEGIKRV